MNVTSGISIIRNTRIEHFRIRFGDLGLSRIFTESELAYALHKVNWVQHLGARFAAKCAFFQALGWNKWRNYCSVAVERDNLGAPVIALSDTVLECYKLDAVMAIRVSMSHIDDYSIANILIERK